MGKSRQKNSGSESPKISVTPRDAKKFLSQHGLNCNSDIYRFLEGIHLRVATQNKSGRVPIPFGFLKDHGIEMQLFAEVYNGALVAIKT